MVIGLSIFHDNSSVPSFLNTKSIANPINFGANKTAILAKHKLMKPAKKIAGYRSMYLITLPIIF